MTFDALARLDANNSFSRVIGVCRLINRTRQQYAEHEQARRKCHHDSQEKPVIRFHSHTTRPSFPRSHHWQMHATLPLAPLLHHALPGAAELRGKSLSFGRSSRIGRTVSA